MEYDYSLVNIFRQLTNCHSDEEIFAYFRQNKVNREGSKPKEFEKTDYILYIGGTHKVSYNICDKKNNKMAELASRLN